jgi:voltage-gated potassium channel
MLRNKIYEIIFEAETKSGKAFDVILLWLIVLSVLTVCLESVKSLSQEFGDIFIYLEWIFTIIFLIEYLLRLYCIKKPLGYAFSFFGLVDLFAILPGILGLLIPGGSSLLVIRGFRLLRVFRLFKLGRYIGEADVLKQALKASRYKISVFLIAVMSLAITVGTLMYLIEGGQNGFTSIPRSIYWAIVTMTTVGYGDIAPQTTLGQMLASLVMIMGYGIIAVPTGILSVELSEAYKQQPSNTNTCQYCVAEGHAPDSIYCRLCGHQL